MKSLSLIFAPGIFSIIFISCSDKSYTQPNEIEFSGDAIRFPINLTQLQSELGIESRAKKNFMGDMVYTWDDLGIYAFTKKANYKIVEITFAFSSRNQSFQPQKSFNDTISHAYTKITKNTSVEQLKDLGFELQKMHKKSYKKEEGDLTIYVFHENDEVVEVSFSLP